MNLLRISSFDFEITKLGSSLGSMIMDLLSWLMMSINYVAATICDGMQSIVEWLLQSDSVTEFLNGGSGTIARYYHFSIALGILFLLLFGGWQIIKRNVEPDKSPPLSSIIWEIGKCTVSIFLFSMVFTTVFDLTTALQNDLTKVYNATETKSTMSASIISSMIESNYPKYISTKDMQKYVETSLNSDITSSTCSGKLAGVTIYDEDNWTKHASNSLRFWGCDVSDIAPFYNFRTGDTSSIKGYEDKLETGYGVSSNKINNIKECLGKDGDGMDSTACEKVNNYDSKAIGMLWIDSARRGYSSPSGGHLMECHTFFMVVSLVAFTIALFLTAMALCTRLFELIVLFIVAPAVIGSSICRQEARGNLWKLLGSLLLQSVGTLLTLYMGVYFMSVISGIEVDGFNTMQMIILKMVLIISDGVFMIKGSKIIQTFISDTAGLGQGLAGTMAALGAGIGAIGIGKSALGMAAKAPATIRDGLRAMDTAAHRIPVNNAVNKARKNPTQKNMAAMARAEENFQNYLNSTPKQQNADGTYKRNFGNVLSATGDKLLGKKREDQKRLESKDSKTFRVSDELNKKHNFDPKTKNFIDSTDKNNKQDK